MSQRGAAPNGGTPPANAARVRRLAAGSALRRFDTPPPTQAHPGAISMRHAPARSPSPAVFRSGRVVDRFDHSLWLSSPCPRGRAIAGRRGLVSYDEFRLTLLGEPHPASRVSARVPHKPAGLRAPAAWSASAADRLARQPHGGRPRCARGRPSSDFSVVGGGEGGQGLRRRTACLSARRRRRAARAGDPQPRERTAGTVENGNTDLAPID